MRGSLIEHYLPTLIWRIDSPTESGLKRNVRQKCSGNALQWSGMDNKLQRIRLDCVRWLLQQIALECDKAWQSVTLENDKVLQNVAQRWMLQQIAMEWNKAWQSVTSLLQLIIFKFDKAWRPVELCWCKFPVAQTIGCSNHQNQNQLPKYTSEMDAAL